MLDSEVALIINKTFSGKFRTHLALRKMRIYIKRVSTNDEPPSTRLQAAIVKCSDGSISKLNSAIKLAKIDWRDVLMQAGFGYDVNTHKTWIEEQLK